MVRNEPGWGILVGMLHLDRTTRGIRAAGLALVGLFAPACQTGPADDGPDSASAASASERVPIGGVEWYVDYDSAVEIAREQDKALWVHFGENPG